MGLWTTLALAGMAVLSGSHASGGPSQVHLALAGNDFSGMAFSWVTPGPGASTVKYGRSEGALDWSSSAESPSTQYTYCNYTSGFMHHVVVTTLEPRTTYFYVVGADSYGWSVPKTFTTPPRVGDLSKPLSIGILGDLGQTNYSEQTLAYLEMTPHLDAIFVVGDLSYADTVQERWDSWGHLVEPSTSTKPWMVGPGNHEIELSCALVPFVPYQARFRMPHMESRAPRGNLFYSFDVGGVHTIVLTPYVPTFRGSAQYAWLERDLAALDRQRTPFVVVLMHAPWYNSNKAHQNHHEPQRVMKKDMEALLHAARVNLVLAGHVHAYERSVPVFQDKPTADGPIYITIGDGGNREGLADTFIEPAPAWSAFRRARYGYGHLVVENATHARFEWHLDDLPQTVADSVWLRQP
ncbi:purple acid phosphatase 20-like [Achlya hypogyna]|uniref:Purple acid phosphatase n=1 Tax=Achlya hypogyna TaxID=1202772 RepID=A0A1V9YH41_ACHHY|nr:purple acid phosphatase 20-like [Achlya hypogyna]